MPGNQAMPISHEAIRLRDVVKGNMNSFRVFAPDENTFNKLDAIYQVSKKFWIAETFPRTVTVQNWLRTDA